MAISAQPIFLTALSALAVGFNAAQAGAAEPALAADPMPVALDFQAVVGDQLFSCSATYRLGMDDTPVSASDFRLYVSAVALVDAAGNAVPVQLTQDGKWQHDTVALLDFEDKTGRCTNGTAETNTQIVGTVPAGDYSAVRFTLGVPFALNHDDATLAPSPLNLTALWWNWQGGYKFLRVDLAIDTAAAYNALPLKHQPPGASASSPSAPGHAAPGHTAPGHAAPGHSASGAGFAVHLGSTGCQPGSGPQPSLCLQPNRAEIFLERYALDQDLITVDLAALVQSSQLAVNAPNTPPGCMSSPDDGDCQGIMQNLGLPFGASAEQAHAGGTQTVFQVQRR